MKRSFAESPTVAAVALQNLLSSAAEALLEYLGAAEALLVYLGLSSAQVGVPETGRATNALAAANFRKLRGSENIAESPLEYVLSSFW